MSSTGEMIRIALFALLAGVAIPVLVQLFVTLRTVRAFRSTVAAPPLDGVASPNENHHPQEKSQ